MSHPPSSGHASLPPRPPPATSTGSTFRKSTNDAPKPAFAGFAPRAVTSSAHYSASPVTNYSAQPTYSTQPTYSAPASASAYPSVPAQPAYDYQAAPQIKNPFVPNSGASTANPYGAYDPEAEAQLQQWQSAYAPKDDKPGMTAVRNPTTAPSRTDTPTQPGGQAKQLTVKREGGGTTWTDDSLLEWDPAHFRIFVGNLAGEVTDDSLLKAFAKYPSVQKARVVRDKRTTKSKGFGFVSFADGDDYFQAAREMQGKYIGSHPVQIKRAQSEVRPTTVNNHLKGKHNKHKGKGGPGGHNKVDHGGIQKAPKTKGGLKVLG